MEAAANTRADKLIQRIEREAQMFGRSEIGQLHGEIRRLCGELANNEPIRSRGLDYIPATLDKGLPVTLGVKGQGEDVEVAEVWCNGLDIEAHLSEEAMDSLRQQAMATDEEMREDERTNQAIANREAAIENALEAA